MVIEYITQEGLDDLKVNVESYREYMFDDTNERIVNHLRKRGYLAKSNVECEPFKLNAKSELENIKIIHKKLGNKIPQSLALNNQFWGGFSIIHCWEYVRSMQDRYFKENRSTEDMMKQFVPFKHGKKRRSFVQCVSRLYWAGMYLFDKDRKGDEFWAIEQLIMNAFPSYIMLFSSYNCLANKNVSLGIMDALYELQSSGVELKREDHFIPAFKFVDGIGGTMLLDCFSREEIKEMVINNLPQKRTIMEKIYSLFD